MQSSIATNLKWSSIKILVEKTHRETVFLYFFKSLGLKQKSGKDKDKDGTLHFLSLVTSIIKTKQILSHPAHANILFPVGET